MIEINRKLYLKDYKKSENYAVLKRVIYTFLEQLNKRLQNTKGFL